MAPSVAVDDDRIDLLQARRRLAQWPRRYTEAVAHAARAVDDGDLERAREPVMLQAVIRQHDVDALALEQRCYACDAVGPRDDGTARAPCEQHGLVADLARIACRRHGARPLGALAAIAARHDADLSPALLQLLGEPDHERRLTRAADADVADDDHGNRDLDGRAPATPISRAPQAGKRDVKGRDRQQGKAHGTLAVPNAVQDLLYGRHAFTRR